MENASRALTIAGGVLIALLILASLLYMVQSTSQYTEEQEKQKEREQITAFNREYESYDKTLMRGTDVVTVINMANNHNKNNIDSPELKIYTYVTLTIEDIGQNNNKMQKDVTYPGDSAVYQAITNPNTNTLTTFKRKFFKCTGLTYSSQTGRVDSMSFEEIDVGNIPDY